MESKNPNGTYAEFNPRVIRVKSCKLGLVATEPLR